MALSLKLSLFQLFANDFMHKRAATIAVAIVGRAITRWEAIQK
jgi:hypothetical protein